MNLWQQQGRRSSGKSLPVSGDADVENSLMNTAEERESGTNWESSIDIYTLSYAK